MRTTINWLRARINFPIFFFFFFPLSNDFFPFHLPSILGWFRSNFSFLLPSRSFFRCPWRKHLNQLFASNIRFTVILCPMKMFFISSTLLTNPTTFIIPVDRLASLSRPAPYLFFLLTAHKRSENVTKIFPIQWCFLNTWSEPSSLLCHCWFRYFSLERSKTKNFHQHFAMLRIF